jgi:hypothetical protein
MTEKKLSERLIESIENWRDNLNITAVGSEAVYKKIKGLDEAWQTFTQLALEADKPCEISLECQVCGLLKGDACGQCGRVLEAILDHCSNPACPECPAWHYLQTEEARLNKELREFKKYNPDAKV